MTEEETKEQETAEEVVKGEETPREENLSSGKPKVLIAEDNPVIRKSLSNFLEKWGYSSVEAESGDDAVKLFDEQPDLRLAILDWNLPGLSGMQVCQRVRSRPAGEYIYILMFSARKSIEEQIMALDGGADDYLVKPSKPSLLRARLGAGRRIIELALSQKT